MPRCFGWPLQPINGEAKTLTDPKVSTCTSRLARDSSLCLPVHINHPSYRHLGKASVWPRKSYSTRVLPNKQLSGRSGVREVAFEAPQTLGRCRHLAVPSLVVCGYHSPQ